ncbi:pectate lyase-like [Populus alba x Populus x berolinensis]|nr:pectate lyase-like [Populus alba x Populus x berolinensis]
MAVGKAMLIFVFTLATLIPSLLADIGIFDDVWRKRAEEAKKMTLEAYVPDPEEATDAFNVEVNKYSLAKNSSSLYGASGSTNITNLDLDDDDDNDNDFEQFANSTRRSLRQGRRKHAGPCQVTNPIDRCWRCQRNWAKNRKQLAKCALGFGRRTTGGMAGRIYVVTDSSDNNVMKPKPGTLRHAVIQKEPLWIIFSKNMNIKLSKELIMSSHKTIDGRGHHVHISYGAGITIQFIRNVIIHGIRIHHIIATSGGNIRDSVDHYGIRTNSDGDGISIFGSTDVWIDHVSMSRCTDGLIDAIMGSTAITISNCHFTHHNDAILLGASDSYSGDHLMQVTVAFNHFGQGLVQRMPRCRWGFFHVVNNDYTHWRLYAIGGSKHPTIISQGNRFIAPPESHLKQVTKRDYATKGEWSKWTWRSENDLMMNGAFFVQSGKARTKKPNRKFMIKAKPGAVATRMTRFAGALDCKPGRKC